MVYKSPIKLWHLVPLLVLSLYPCSNVSPLFPGNVLSESFKCRFPAIFVKDSESTYNSNCSYYNTKSLAFQYKIQGIIEFKVTVQPCQNTQKFECKLVWIREFFVYFGYGVLPLARFLAAQAAKKAVKQPNRACMAELLQFKILR